MCVFGTVRGIQDPFKPALSLEDINSINYDVMIMLSFCNAHAVVLTGTNDAAYFNVPNDTTTIGYFIL